MQRRQRTLSKAECQDGVRVSLDEAPPSAIVPCVSECKTRAGLVVSLCLGTRGASRDRSVLRKAWLDALPRDTKKQPMPCVLGLERSRFALSLLCGSWLVAAACSTDVDYLRAATGPSGGGGDVVSAGGGSNGGQAGSSSDAGELRDGNGGMAGAGHDDSAGEDGSADRRESGPPAPTPLGVALTPTDPSGQVQPSAGGSASTDFCDQGVAIGFNGTVQPPGAAYTYPTSIQLVCGKVSVTGNGGSFQVKTTFDVAMPIHGAISPVPQNRMCPSDQVVVGFDSRQATYVEQLTFRCAPLTIATGSDGYTLSIGVAVPLTSIGGSGGVPFMPISCPTGSIATGGILRTGLSIDAFGLYCSTPSLIFASPSR